MEYRAKYKSWYDGELLLAWITEKGYLMFGPEATWPKRATDLFLIVEQWAQMNGDEPRLSARIKHAAQTEFGVQMIADALNECKAGEQYLYYGTKELLLDYHIITDPTKAKGEVLQELWGDADRDIEADE